MRLLSVNVGLPKEMEWEGKTFLSAIGKAPVSGRVTARTINLDGDGQADRVNHGGAMKAVYAYPHEHYAHWSEFLGEETPMGGLGENLTLSGFMEQDVFSGDRFRIGNAEFIAIIPREPCFKLAALRSSKRIVVEMLRSGFCGWYLAVAQEGEVGSGDAVEIVSRDPRRVPISELAKLLTKEPIAREVLERALELETLTPYWRGKVDNLLKSKE